MQVSFEFSVKQVWEQLKNIANGEYTTPDTEKRKFGTIVFAALSVEVTEIQAVLFDVRELCALPSFSC